MVFIEINNTKSFIFVILVSILLLTIGILSIFFKFYKFNQNSKLMCIFNNQNLIYFSSLISLLIGIIFSSLVNFKKINEQNANDCMWVWECISFLYGFGMYLVALSFIFAWLLIPIVAWKAATSYLNQNNNFKLELKKIGFILFFILISTLVTNTTWWVPFNDVETPLTIFKINDSTFQKDMWFVGSKFLFENAFLTIWYPWTFLGYSIITLCLCFLVNYFKNKKDDKPNQKVYLRIQKVLSWPYLIVDLLGSVGTFSFICSYFLFNWSSFFIHIGLVIFYFVACFLIIDSFLFLVLSLKYKKFKHKKFLIHYLIIKSFKNVAGDYQNTKNQSDWWYLKLEKSPVKKWNLCDASIIGLIFTIYLGFSNNFSINPLDEIVYNQSMHDANFWILVLISAFVYNFLAYNQPSNISLARNFMGASTYSIAPGLQTGIFGWIMPSISKIVKFTDNLICMVI